MRIFTINHVLYVYLYIYISMYVFNIYTKEKNICILNLVVSQLSYLGDPPCFLVLENSASLCGQYHLDQLQKAGLEVAW